MLSRVFWFSVLWLSEGCFSIVFLSRVLKSSVVLLSTGCSSVVLSKVMGSRIRWLNADCHSLVVS